MTNPYNAGVGGPAWRAQQRRSSMTDTESHIKAQAAIARSKGESPGRCELCGHIILYGEKYGQCPDTDALTCETCATEGSEEWDG